MPWLTTKDGRHFNTDWIDQDAKQKERQINANKKQADEKNGKAVDYSNKPVDNVSDEEVKRRKDLAREAKDAVVAFYTQHKAEFDDLTVDSPITKKFIHLTEKADSESYNAYKVMSPVVTKAEKWNTEALTVLKQDEGAVVRKDMLRNKDLFLAISSAATGTANTSTTTLDTAVDTLYKKDKSIYDVFSDTRKMLKERYGDEITLYRAGTNATRKATINMTSTEKNAKQYASLYGSSVTSKKIKVDDILAININRTGGYEEFIILNRR